MDERDIDIAFIEAATRRDEILEALAAVARGLNYPVGLLANGMTIYGELVGEEHIFEAVDSFHAKLIQPGEPGDVILGQWTKKAQERKEKYDALVARNENLTREEMSDEDRRASISDALTSLTIKDATVIPPGAPRFEVPLLRVGLASVVGWWLLPVENGRATWTHPG